jgi:HD-GYP domain-containing protein (c-di-GMP phosphodiesterase class II)
MGERDREEFGISSRMDKTSASYLIVERGPEKGKRIRLLQFPASIGRDPANDIVIKDEEISRNHLRIKQRGRIYVVEDLESRNGTYINGDRVLNSILKNGDRLLIGSTELTFVTQNSQIQLANEIVQFNMVVADELGIDGPITVGDAKPEPEFAPLRINIQNLAHQITADSSAVKTLFDLHSNMLVIDQLEEACSSFLKSMMKLMPYINRAALFVWSDSTRRLIPMAARHRQKRQKFLLSQRAFEDVLARKQSVILQAKNPNVTQHGRTRMVLPMMQDSRVLCLLHMEVDDPSVQLPNRELELALLFIQRCTPTFESMMLRREMDSWMLGMVDTIISTIEANDTYTRGHSERVSKYSMAVADELKLNRETKRLLMISSLMHDVGKIGIPDNILKKAALLTAEEYEEMKLHPSIGADIVSHVPDAHRFISGVKHHHEKWDGTGYPDGLVGEEIPFFARIVAIADVFDAMVSGRSYSGFIDQSDAVTRLSDEKDIFDPEVVRAFVRAYENGSITLKTSTQNNLPAAVAADDAADQINSNADFEKDENS